MSLTAARSRTWLTEDDCDLDAFRLLVEQDTDPADHPSAERVEQNVPLYDSDRLRSLTATADGRREVQTELIRALLDGPGIVVLKGAFADTDVVDRASDAFRALIEEERAAAPPAAITSPSRAPTTECGMHWTRWPYGPPRSSPTTTPTTCWR